MVLGQGAFIYHLDKQGVAFSDEHTLGDDMKLDLILKISQGRAEVWIDGRRVLEADVKVEAAPIGIGVVGGCAEFRDLKVRPLE
jgi:hypothetical protein